MNSKNKKYYFFCQRRISYSAGGQQGGPGAFAQDQRERRSRDG